MIDGKATVLVLGALSVAAAILYPGKARANDEIEPVSTSQNHNGKNISAASIDWSRIPDFSPGEFHGELSRLDAGVVFALQKLRDRIGRIIISPVGSEAIARKKPGTWHDVTGGKLSKAIDIMPIDSSLEELYQAVKTIPEIGGVGVYPDWLPYPGAHIDLRARKPGGGLATWSGIKLADGSQVYRGIDEAFV